MALETYYNEDITQAIKQIHSTYGDVVSVNDKQKSLIKFGRNANISTTVSTIQQFTGTEVHETYTNTNSIDSVVTSDATYTGTVKIEGHTIDSGNLTFVSQTATLTGETPVTLTTPLARATRLVYNTSDTLASNSENIYVYESGGTVTAGVPQTDSDIHILLNGEWGQSQKCSTSISSTDYWLITKVYGGVLRQQTRTVDISLQIRKVDTTPWGWRTLFSLPVSTNGSDWFSIDAPPVFVIPKNHDVRMIAESSGTSTAVIGGMAGYLAKVVS
jgi:hypothetical protein